MRLPLTLCVSLGLIPFLANPASAKRGRGDQDAIRNGWTFSLAEGKAEAKKSGKPIMAVVRCVP